MTEEEAGDGGRQCLDHIGLGTCAKNLDLTGYVMGSQQKEALFKIKKTPHTFESKGPYTYKHICACIDTLYLKTLDSL